MRTFDALTETVNRDSVIDLMAAGSVINALDLHSYTGTSGRIVVPAGEGLEAPRIAVEYYIANENDWNAPDLPPLILAVVGLDSERLEWEADDDPFQIFDNISTMLIAQGQARLAAPLSPETFFKNLRAAVELATLSRSALPGGWLQSTPLLEMIADDWMITDAGVEVRGRGLVIRRADYPHDVPGDERSPYRVSSAPADLDQATWDFAAERGIHYFTGTAAYDPWGSP